MYKTVVDKLKNRRSQIASQAQEAIAKINKAICALLELDGAAPVTEVVVIPTEPPVEVPVKHVPKRKAESKLTIRKHERGGIILKRIGMHYRDVMADAVRKSGRPVTTEEIWKHLQNLAGKRLDRKKYMARIGICLRYDARKGRVGQTKVHGNGRGHTMSLWNVRSASKLNEQDVLSADIK